MTKCRQTGQNLMDPSLYQTQRFCYSAPMITKTEYNVKPSRIFHVNCPPCHTLILTVHKLTHATHLTFRCLQFQSLSLSCHNFRSIPCYIVHGQSQFNSRLHTRRSQLSNLTRRHPYTPLEVLCLQDSHIDIHTRH